MVVRGQESDRLDALVGRDDELARVESLVRNGDRIVTITGPAGVGKTRLATELLRSAGDDRDDGPEWLFVALASVGDPGLVATAIAEAAALDRPPGDAALDVVVAGFGDRRAVIVLDCFEHVYSARDDVQTFLERCPGLAFVVTSRRALGLAEEKEVALGPLAAGDAVSLLRRAARRLAPDIELGDDDGDDDALAAICSRVDGVPLAIELAAARLRLLTPNELASTLQARFDVLGSGMRPGQAHHRTLQAAIDWSYRLLDERDRRLLRALSVFAGSFDRHAVAAVAGIDVVEALDGLEQLVAHQLVRIDTDAGGGRRFRLFDAIREFADLELAVAGEDLAVRQAAIGWAQRLVDDAAEKLIGDEQQVAVALLDGEHDNVRGMLGWYTEGRHSDPAGLRLAAGLWRYWWMRGWVREGCDQMARLFDAYDGPDGSDLATAHRAAGQLHLQVPAPEAARAHLARGLDLFGALEDELGMAECWNTLGILAGFDGDLGRSEELHRAALEVERRHGRRRQQVVALNGLSTVAHLRGDFEESRRLGLENVEVLRAIGDRRALAVVAGSVGENLVALGQPDDALPLIEESLAIAEELGDQWGGGQALARLGRALVCSGDLVRARRVLRDAVNASETTGDRLARAIAEMWLGRCAHLDGDLAAAADGYLRSLQCAEALAHLPGMYAGLRLIAGVAIAAGEVAEAVPLLAAADALHPDRDGPGSGIDARYLPAPEFDEATLDPGELAARRASGAAWSPAQAVAAATAVVAEVARRTLRSAVDPAVAERFGLTRREREVLIPLMERRTDREIAEQFGVSVRTVTTHVSSILRKLGVRSRREVEANARAGGLVVDVA